jgi:hypothetical protein
MFSKCFAFLLTFWLGQTDMYLLHSFGKHTGEGAPRTSAGAPSLEPRSTKSAGE